jgi:Carboxypeptidase regulatory-like domain
MKNSQLLSHGALWLAVCGMCLPTPMAFGNDVAAAQATASQPHVRMHDVALQPGGLLLGQIVDETMQPVAGRSVAIQSNGQTTATTTTDADGVFAVAGLRGGVHQVLTDDATKNCRLWAPGTAPPQAVSHLRFIPGRDEVVRGQWGPPPAYNTFTAWATNPWVIAGVVATAVAVPVLIHNLDDDDDDEDGSL